MKTTSIPTAVVVGHDHQNTLGVIRSLGEGGIRVKAVILSDGGACSTVHSKYVEEAFVIREGAVSCWKGSRNPGMLSLLCRAERMCWKAPGQPCSPFLFYETDVN